AFDAEIEEILKRSNGETRLGRPSQPDQLPGNFARSLVRVIEIVPDRTTGIFRQGFEPGPSCRVVVRASVNNRVWSKVAGEMRVAGIPIKGKLQHAHSGQFEFVSERKHVGSDEPQILGNEGQVAQFALNRFEEIAARTWHPLASLCRPSPGRNVPRRA